LQGKQEVAEDETFFQLPGRQGAQMELGDMKVPGGQFGKQAEEPGNEAKKLEPQGRQAEEDVLPEKGL